MDIHQIQPLLQSSHNMTNATLVSIGLLEKMAGEMPEADLKKEIQTLISACSSSIKQDTLFGCAIDQILTARDEIGPLDYLRNALPSPQPLEEAIQAALSCNILKNNTISRVLDQALAAGSATTPREIKQNRLAIHHMNACFLEASIPVFNASRDVFPANPDLRKSLEQTAVDMLFATNAMYVKQSIRTQTPPTATRTHEVEPQQARPNLGNLFRPLSAESHLRS